MAVTTEPAWINKSSGISARNGTTSHTIPFGWTAGTGTFLVFVIAGSVTNTNSAGWTERLQPVNNTELSVFTKAGAGESAISITITNNAANYPVIWVAYEFPAGTTWTNGIGATASNDNYPALTGLPGSAQVVFAGRSRSAIAVDSAGSTDWPAGWVEDVDLSTPRNGTDGVFLSVAHQLNVTATSITPTSTPNYTSSFTASRQHVVFALNVATAEAPPETRSVLGSATLKLGASATSASVRTSAGSAPLKTAVTAQASSARTSAGSASLRLSTSWSASSTRVSAPTAVVRVQASATSSQLAGSATVGIASLRLSASALEASVRTSIPTVTLALDATLVSESTRTTASDTYVRMIATASSAQASAWRDIEFQVSGPAGYSFTADQVPQLPYITGPTGHPLTVEAIE